MTHCSDFEFFSPRANPQLTRDQATPGAAFPIHMAPQQIWESTVFGVSGYSRTGLCGLVPLTSGVPVACLLHGFFPEHIRGRSGLGFQRNLELAFSNLSASAEL